MALEHLNLDDLDPYLNYLVGPNGSGKSSIFKAIRTLRDGFHNCGMFALISSLRRMRSLVGKNTKSASAQLDR
jgi:AAA15 family ATPase/GTPase